LAAATASDIRWALLLLAVAKVAAGHAAYCQQVGSNAVLENLSFCLLLGHAADVADHYLPAITSRMLINSL
jgi:hypothetical protein